MRLGYLITAGCLTASTFAFARAPIMNADFIFGQNRIIVLCNGHWKAENIDSEGFSDRDIALVEVNDDIATSVTFDKTNKVHRNPIGDYEPLVRRAACTEKTEYVLIGKDTGVKQRWQNTLPLGDLYAAIDAMPMRRFEMRQRGED